MRDSVRPVRSSWWQDRGRWKQVIAGTWRETNDDNVSLIAAGVAFYGFFALVPLLGAAVLTYGLVADPHDVARHVGKLTTVLPAEAARLIGDQLLAIQRSSDGKKGFGLLVALGLALFGARAGATSTINALNIAYEEHERRSFIQVNLLGLAITAGAIVAGIVAIAAIAALGRLEALFPGLPGVVVVLGKIVLHVALVVAGMTGAALLYRFAPSHTRPSWAWLTPGSVLAGVLWLVVTLGFGIYVAKFAHYGAIYGSLSAVIVLMTWLYLSSFVLILGAELNCELARPH